MSYKSVDEMVNKLSGKEFKRKWRELKDEQAVNAHLADWLMRNPVITVKEISRILINLRKWLINNKKAVKCVTQLGVIALVRQELKLRSRARRMINVQKNVRSDRKIHSKRK